MYLFTYFRFQVLDEETTRQKRKLEEISLNESMTEKGEKKHTQRKKSERPVTAEAEKVCLLFEPIFFH